MRIGLVLNILDEEYQISLYRGIKRRAEELGIQIICFQKENTKFQSDGFMGCFPNKEYFNLDGIILLTSVVTDSQTLSTKEDVQKIWGELPVVSVGQKIEGIPSLLIQTDESMKNLTEHLVCLHNYRKFVYIGGPQGHQDAINREQLFIKLMEEFKKTRAELAYTVLHGNFTEQSAVGVMESYVKDNPDVIPDVVVCANDNMAAGVYKYFQMNNESARYDNVAVTGFDDIPHGRISIPALTTVHQPLDRTGEQAVEILYESILGKAVPFESSVESSVVYRESCGCRKSELDINTLRDSFGKIQSSYVLAEQMLRIVSRVGRDLNNDTDEHNLVSIINYNTTMLGIKDFCILKFSSHLKQETSLSEKALCVRPVFVKAKGEALTDFPLDKNGEISLGKFYDYLCRKTDEKQPLVFRFLNVDNDYTGIILYDAPENVLPYVILLSVDIALALNKMDVNEERRRYSEYLECEVTRRTHELVEANNKRMAVEAEVLKISEIERQRFSNDLHDDICQRLAGISMLCRSYSQQEDSVKKAEMEELAALVSDTLQRTRQYAHNSYPVDLENIGLDASLSNLCNSFEQQSNISCEYEWAIPQTVLFDKIQKLNIFRIIQEALHNVMKHSEADKVSVRCLTEKDHIIVSIADNGKGFAHFDEACFGIGLNSMQYRANQIGASFNISNQKSGGACVEIKMSV